MAEIGDLIGTYRLIGLIGGGGMGTVFRAHDERLERDVALKLLSPELSADASFRARFEREARIAGALRHPNIVPVFDAGEWDGQLYLAMMLIEGPNLATVIGREAPLALRRVASVVSQIASALDAAHAQGIVHRDVKPANILLLEHSGPDGNDHAYLADFGLTRSTSAMTQMTRVGTFLGTLAYIAPEQLQGEHIDGRADQYALACSAFEMLSAAPPFKRDSEVALISAHLYTPPPLLSDIRPDLPLALGAVLARAMAKDPDARFASAGAFAQALSQATFGAVAGPNTIAGRAPAVLPVQGIVRGAVARSPEEVSARPITLALIIVLLAVLVGAGGFVLAATLNRPAATPLNSMQTTPAVAQLSPATTPDETASEAPTATSPASAAPPGMPSFATATPPAFPWAISINASANTLPVSTLVTIEAVTNGNVDTVGYVIEISNYATGNVFNTCSSGTTCQAQGAPNQARVTTYLAKVGPPGGQPVAEATTTVTWFVPQPTPTVYIPPPPPTYHPAWSITLQPGDETVAAGQHVTLTATANGDVGATGWYIQIVNADTGEVYKSCTSGYSCSVGATHTGLTRSYQARVSASDGSDVQAVSERITITWQDAAQPTSARIAVTFQSSQAPPSALRSSPC